MLDKVLVAGAVAACLSLVLEVVPGLADLWEKANSKVKALVVFGACLGLPLIALAASCVGLDIGFGAVCPTGVQDVYDALIVGAAAFASSQVVHANAGRLLAFSREYNDGAG